MKKRLIILSVLSLIFSYHAYAQSGRPPVDRMVADLNPVFDGFDKNGDDIIDSEEWLTSGMPKESHIHLFTNLLDTDKNGNISREEFLSSRPIFNMDLDNDGKVTLKEYITANKEADENPIPK